MKTLTVSSVWSGLIKARDEYGPDWVDPNADKITGCKYVYKRDNRIRRCIAGEVLHQHGVSDNKLKQYDPAKTVTGTWRQDGSPVTRIFRDLNHTDDPRPRRYTDAEWLVRAAQALQDNGLTWGYVIDALEPHVDLENEAFTVDGYVTGPDGQKRSIE